MQMQSKNKPSTTEMREIRQMCRMLGKARGRISRKNNYLIFYEIKNQEISKIISNEKMDEYIDSVRYLINKLETID